MNTEDALTTTANVLKKHNKQIMTLIDVSEKLLEHGTRVRVLVGDLIRNQSEIANNQEKIVERLFEIERRLDEAE